MVKITECFVCGAKEVEAKLIFTSNGPYCMRNVIKKKVSNNQQSMDLERYLGKYK